MTTTPTDDAQAGETPLLDLLRAVPLDARMTYNHGPYHSQNIPVGVLCSRAADALADRQARAAQAEQHDRNMDGAREFINAILMGGKLWPNPWGQDVAAAAFFITDGGKSATLHEALQATPKAQAEPVATLHDDGCFTWKRDEYRLKYDRQRAGWRMDVYATPPAQPKAEPPLTESERAVDAPVTPSDYMAGGANVQHRQREAEAAGQEARESDLRVRVREGDARQRGSQQPSEGVPAAQVERPADAPQPAAVVLNPATGDVRFEPEQQSTAQPVAEAYQRGIVQGMNDVLHNGIDWARAKFGGAPLTAPPRTDAPALTDEHIQMALMNASDPVLMRFTPSQRLDIGRAIERALRTASKPTGGEPKRLWLWKNFVDGKPEYWAFDNAFPIHLNYGDPQVLGEPCGYALFKPSRTGREVADEEVLRRIAASGGKE